MFIKKMREKDGLKRNKPLLLFFAFLVVSICFNLIFLMAVHKLYVKL